MDNNNWNMVIQTGKELIEIDPENFLANFGLGMAYAILNEFELSLQYFKKANQLIPSSVGPFWGMTLVYARKGDKDQAIESLKFAVDRGYSITGLENDPFFPEDFRNDPRLNNFIR
jgi:tetratricopeptide (TPR) repeat protein